MRVQQAAAAGAPIGWVISSKWRNDSYLFVYFLHPPSLAPPDQGGGWRRGKVDVLTDEPVLGDGAVRGGCTNLIPTGATMFFRSKSERDWLAPIGRMRVFSLPQLTW